MFFHCLLSLLTFWNENLSNVKICHLYASKNLVHSSVTAYEFSLIRITELFHFDIFEKTITNGFIVSDQCRKCGLGGAKKSHFGPVNNERCVLFKYKLRKEKIRPILPNRIFLKNVQKFSFESDDTKFTSAFLQIKRIKIEDSAVLAKSVNCPVCGLVCKSKKDAASKIQE